MLREYLDRLSSRAGRIARMLDTTQDQEPLDGAREEESEIFAIPQSIVAQTKVPPGIQALMHERHAIESELAILKGALGGRSGLRIRILEVEVASIGHIVDRWTTSTLDKMIANMPSNQRDGKSHRYVYGENWMLYVVDEAGWT